MLPYTHLILTCRRQKVAKSRGTLSRLSGAQHECATTNDAAILVFSMQRMGFDANETFACSYFCFFIDSSRFPAANQKQPYVEVHPKTTKFNQNQHFADTYTPHYIDTPFCLNSNYHNTCTTDTKCPEHIDRSNQTSLVQPDKTCCSSLQCRVSSLSNYVVLPRVASILF